MQWLRFIAPWCINWNVSGRYIGDKGESHVGTVINVELHHNIARLYGCTGLHTCNTSEDYLLLLANPA